MALDTGDIHLFYFQKATPTRTSPLIFMFVGAIIDVLIEPIWFEWFGEINHGSTCKLGTFPSF